MDYGEQYTQFFIIIKTVNFGKGFSIFNFDYFKALPSLIHRNASLNFLVEVRSECEMRFITSDLFLDLLWRL